MKALPHTLATCLLLAASPALADGHNAASPQATQDAQLIDENATPEQRLRAAAIANPNLEWHDGVDGEADRMVMLSDVLFGFGTSRLSPDAIDALSAVANELPGLSGLHIVGHTDSIGTEADNLALAEARAMAVKLWFVVHSPVYPEVLTVVGMGEAEPIADNLLEDGGDNPEGRARNRRVEFLLPRPQVPEILQPAQAS